MKQITTLLLNPFEKYSETILLIFGTCFTILGTLLGFYFNARFDGVLDMHLVKNSTLKEVTLDNLINIFCLLVFLFGVAKFINSKTRFIDILNTILISRFAIYVFVLLPTPSKEVIKNLTTGNITQISDLDIFLLSMGGLMALLGLVWYIILLYNGFKTASNAKKILPIVLFVVSILLAEILSKILISYFN
ncbi:hypothetical protein Fleli_2738 [Bernardetia litoralis DSM 6794]|uniref:Yip1 domain-containing protein n=1 Tax=Bernardetia litoralis (strain ATCC 23117 / DSM 6794 / NBRC 15988 / NCIMB 1366 / Fx l1 / Sio-4) TaxID=880071 RepID=I4AMA7_BERLS|nr:hypothetical protein [Bernardetia litoralis]AFM05092.1 hypothetical protein Fleli_2738 [Bernardetia litoralis DSM 6794]